MKKILITGGPSTGKTSLVSELKKHGFYCFDEISRELTQRMRNKGIEQYFLNNPIQFSRELFKLRFKQYEQKVDNFNFQVYDRGPIDVLAYLDFKTIEIPNDLINKSRVISYDHIFILRPWEDIYVNDSERYETFIECINIHKSLLKTYKNFDLDLIDVPNSSIEERIKFVKRFIVNEKGA